VETLFGAREQCRRCAETLFVSVAVPLRVLATGLGVGSGTPDRRVECVGGMPYALGERRRALYGRRARKQAFHRINVTNARGAGIMVDQYSPAALPFLAD
jgi:hypothetical protein